MTMSTRKTSIRLKGIVGLLIVCCVGHSSAVSAQTTQGARPSVDTILNPGMAVWITDASGREEKTRIVDVSGTLVTTEAGGDTRRLQTTDVRRVRVSQSDSVVNGALIGAGAGVASGLFVCRLTEPWEVCRNNIGPMIGWGAIGAGAGLAIDAVIRERKTIYEAAPRGVRLYAAPVIASGTRGLQIAFRF
jgi:hypothetical protein